MTTTPSDVYVTVVAPADVFADPSYQRAVDMGRARTMAATWDRKLAGIIEVSDRGEIAPRYAVIDGQHRWVAAGLLDEPTALVANVHTGLTVADEAALFDKLNRQRRQTGTFDHWRARRIAGDPTVVGIEQIAAGKNLIVDLSPSDGRIACVAALEKIAKLGGLELVDDTLGLIVEVWGPRRDALDSPIVHGIALVLHYLREPLDLTRLGDAMLDVIPRHLKSQAHALRDITDGATPKLVAIALMTLYNKRPGRRILVSTRTFGGKPESSTRPRSDTA